MEQGKRLIAPYIKGLPDISGTLLGESRVGSPKPSEISTFGHSIGKTQSTVAKVRRSYTF